ncbi:ABC transporter family protein [Spironucleus salmonicida]|uniref:ABC transporter family protein n=2 Tax=Spironucleus salmonicida TaxID=348837 RepID=A0A9P8RWN9_9EUKA|nr:ABC transporter family protein [Spironucleus salmonicida]
MNKPLSQFFLFRAKSLTVIVVAQLILPLLMAIGLSGMIFLISNSLFTSNSVNIDIPTLPKLPQNENFVYLSASPNTELTRDLLDFVLAKNGIKGHRTRFFESPEEANSYFAKKNLFTNQSFDVEFARQVFCDDVLQVADTCNSTFLDTFQDDLHNRYPQYSGPLLNDEIFIHINILQSEEMIQNMPLNLTVEVVVNNSFLEKLLVEQPDPLFQQFTFGWKKAFWTGYGIALQTQIDQYLVDYFAKVDYHISYNFLEPLRHRVDDVMNINLLFSIANSLSLTVIILMAAFIATQNRDNIHVVLKRLGVLHHSFYTTAIVFTFVPTLVSTETFFVFGHYVGILPFSGITVGFCMVAALASALIISVGVNFISVIFGSQRTRVIIFVCIMCLAMILLPIIFHQALFFSTTFFDPSMLPQAITWTVTFLVPIFGVVMVYDSMYFALSKDIKSQYVSSYIWKPQQTLVSLNFLTTQGTKQFLCILQNIDAGHICKYQHVTYWHLYLVLGFSAAFFFLFIIYLAHVIPEKGFYGLHPLFFLKKDLWQWRRLVPDSNHVNLQNISVTYKGKWKVWRRSKIVGLANCSFSLLEGSSAVIGETSAGKSTLLGAIAGDVQLDRQASCSSTVFGTFDLTNSIHAYLVKPFTGYCPQDFSNVFLDMSVLNNVAFSFSLRQYRTGAKISIAEQSAIIQDLLATIGLDSPSVQRRTAKRLSGGMLRRLACCNAIVGSNNLVMFDEISAGVDPILKRKIWEIVRKIECSVVLTTHDMTEVEEIAQKINFIDRGAIFQHNQTLPQVRQMFQGYSLTFNFESENFTEEKLRELFPYEFTVIGIRRHSVQLEFNEISQQVLLELHLLLETLEHDKIVSTYTLQKFKLQDTYVKLQMELQKQETIKYRKTSRGYINNKFMALVQNMFRLEFFSGQISFIYPLMVLMVFVTLFLGVAYIILAQTAGNSKERSIDIQYQNQKQKFFEKCSKQCQNFYRDQENYIENLLNICLQQRPKELFTFNILEGPYCIYYVTFLGLDYYSRSTTSLGDYRQSHENMLFNYLVVDPLKRNDLLPQISQQTQNKVLDQSFQLEDFDYDKLYENSKVVNPLKYPDLAPLQQLVIGNHYIRTETGCYNLEYCKQACINRDNQFLKCGEQPKQIYCTQQCIQEFKCDYQSKFVIRNQNIKVFNTSAQAIYHYNMIGKNSHIKFNGNNTLPTRDIINQLNNNLYSSGIVEFNKQNSKYVNIQISLLLPLNIFWYGANALEVQLADKLQYKCDGLYINETYVVYIGVRGIERYIWIDDTTVRLPCNPPVVFYDIGNNMLTQQTSALFRKYLFANSIDYSPWNFTYSIQQSEMPGFSNVSIQPNMEINNSNEITNLITIVVLLIGGFLPLFFTGQLAGMDCDNAVNKLFHFHNVKMTLLFLAHSTFYTIVALIMALATLLIIAIICYPILANLPNPGFVVGLYIMQALACVPTGILMGKILNSGKYAAVVSLLITIFAVVFQIMTIVSDSFAQIISIMIPAYGFCYIISLVIHHQVVQQKLYVTIFISYFLQFFVFFLVAQKNRIMFIIKVILKFKKTRSEVALLDTHVIEYYGDANFFDVQNVTHQYERSQFALKDVSFSVKENCVFGLLGSNGSGKSTLMHSFAGIIQIDQGAAVIGPYDLYKTYHKYKSFTMVPQHDIFYESLTISQIVQLFSIFNETSQVDQILELLDLSAIRNALISSLSGGIRRKLSLAIALTSKANIIALDEPSTGLGALTKQVIQVATQKLIHLGKTVIITTHDLSEVAQLVDDVVLLKDGRINYCGSVDNMREKNCFQVQISVKRDEFRLKFAQYTRGDRDDYFVLFGLKMSRVVQWAIDNEVGSESYDVCEIDLEEDFMRLIWE